MNRRSFLGLGLAGAPALASEQRYLNRKTGANPFRLRDVGKRPHVFLISLDMVSPDHYHPSRTMHRHMELPAIRSLMADSVTFHNAFCTAPLCAPARAALATGRYTYITANGERAHDGHETTLRPNDVIFQEYLKASGYKTKHAGKGHLGTQKFIDAFDENVAAWDRWAPPLQDDEAYHDHLRRLKVKPQRYRREILALQQDRQTKYASLGGWIEQSDGKPFPMEAQYTHFLVEQAINKLDSALHEGGPVYLQLDIFDPHQPFTIPAGFEARERALRKVVGLPRSYQKVRETDWRPWADQPKIYDFYRKVWGLYRPETVEDYRVANALQMEVIDKALERFLRALKQRGLYEDSMIIFTADHGEMNGRQALVDKGVYLHPDVLRVPLAIKMPGVKPRAVESPVSHLDIAPTLLEVAGVETPARLDGRSLLPLLRGETEGGDRELLFECGWHVGVNFACGFQRWSPSGAHHLYVYNLSSTIDELYDLRSDDPDNLAAKAEHGAVRREMIERLANFLQRDARWIGYWHSFRIDRFHELPRRAEADAQMVRPI